jgi:hypothetical protein
MDESSYIFQLIAGLLFLAAGVHLLRLSRRTRETPERLLGIYFLASGLSLLGWLIPEIFHLESMANRINFVLWFDLIPWALYDVGMIAFLLFARMTFRPNAAWSKWIVTTCILLLFLSLTMWSIQDVENYSIENPWFWCQWAGYTLPQLWITIEAFLNYSGACRRARIGLCDLVVVNRYLLFGCYGVISILGSWLNSSVRRSPPTREPPRRSTSRWAYSNWAGSRCSFSSSAHPPSTSAGLPRKLKGRPWTPSNVDRTLRSRC